MATIFNVSRFYYTYMTNIFYVTVHIFFKYNLFNQKHAYERGS